MCNVYFSHYDDTRTGSAHKAHLSWPNGADCMSYRESTYPFETPLALDVLSMPASEAYAERVFSVCGYLSAGRRNRLSKNMECRVFLKMNSILSRL